MTTHPKPGPWEEDYEGLRRSVPEALWEKGVQIWMDADYANALERDLSDALAALEALVKQSPLISGLHPLVETECLYCDAELPSRTFADPFPHENGCRWLLTRDLLARLRKV